MAPLEGEGCLGRRGGLVEEGTTVECVCVKKQSDKDNVDYHSVFKLSCWRGL